MGRRAGLIVFYLCLAASICVLVDAVANSPVRVAHYEPVVGFKVNFERTVVTFSAYNKLWKFDIEPSLVNDNNLYYFHGKLSHEANSLASFTLAPAYVTGMIFTQNPHETYWLEAPSANATNLVIYKQSDIVFDKSLVEMPCVRGRHGVQVPAHHRAAAASSSAEKNNHKRGVYTVALITDQRWTDPSSNPTWYGVTATIGLINDVNAIYAKAGLSQFQATVVGSLANQWSTADTLSSMLSYLSDRAANYPGYDFIHWLAGVNIGGLAYVGVCGSQYPVNYKIGVSGLANWSRLWTVKTIAHELGHNRGANHDFADQCNTGQTSGCQCSLMSYCFPADGTGPYGATNYLSATSQSEIGNTCP